MKEDGAAKVRDNGDARETGENVTIQVGEYEPVGEHLPNWIILNLFNPEQVYEMVKKAGPNIKETVMADIKTFAIAVLTYDAIMTYLLGYPEIALKCAEPLAEYLIPAMSVLTTLLLITRNTNVDRTLTASIQGLGINNFSFPTFMAGLSLLIQIAKNEPRTAPVYISNWAANTIMAGCGFLGITTAINAFLKKAGHQNVLFTSSPMNHVLSVTGSASTAHAFVDNVEQTLSLVGLDPESTVPYYSRWSAVAIGAVLGFLFANDHTKDNNLVKILAKMMAVFALTATVLAATRLMLISPNAIKVELTILWAIVVPVIAALGFSSDKPKKAFDALTDGCEALSLARFFQLPGLSQGDAAAGFLPT